MEEFDSAAFEELFKNEKLIKSRRTIGMLLRMAEIIKDPNAHPDAKKQAEANIQLMNQGFEPKLIRAPRPPKQPKNTLSEKPIVKPGTGVLPVDSQSAFQAILKPKGLEYHPDLEIHGVTKEMWDKSPKAHQKVFMNYHNDVLGGKYPEEHAKLVAAGKLKAPAQTAAPTIVPTTPAPTIAPKLSVVKDPVEKSLTKLKSLFKAINAIQHSN